MSVAEHKIWTYERYALLPEDGRRHEVIGGEHYVTPAPTPRHQQLSSRLYLALAAAVREGERLFYAPCDVVFFAHEFVQPDLMFLSEKRAARVGEMNIQGAPDLVVEILSDSTRTTDMTSKRDLYDREDVLEYWVVDPKASTVSVYRKASEGGPFGSADRFELDGELRTDRLPAFRLPLAELFAR